MNKEDLQCLIGKYLNGYKVVRVEDDPFVRGQINLFTDEWEYGAFNDRCLVKFFVRNESNSAKVYKELVNKENYNLKQAINEIKDKLLCYGETFDSDIHKQFQKKCLEIINEVDKDD